MTPETLTDPVLAPPEPPKRRPPTTGTLPPPAPPTRPKPSPDMGYRQPTPIWKALLVCAALAAVLIVIAEALT